MITKLLWMLIRANACLFCAKLIALHPHPSQYEPVKKIIFCMSHRKWNDRWRGMKLFNCSLEVDFAPVIKNYSHELELRQWTHPKVLVLFCQLLRHWSGKEFWPTKASFPPLHTCNLKNNMMRKNNNCTGTIPHKNTGKSIVKVEACDVNT